MNQAAAETMGNEARAVDLSRLFDPRAIAVVGATESSRAVGGQPMHYLTTYGYAGEVFPVNPNREMVLGRKCYPSLADIPSGCDVVLIAVAARLVPDVIRQAGAKGIPFAVILSSGFREAGDEGKALEAELIAAIRETGIRAVGPNCMGVLNIPKKVHNGFGQGFGVKDYSTGPVAMATQSGGYGFTLVRNASRAGTGFNYIASVGNSVDLNVLDFIDYFLDCDDVKVVTAFIEGVSDGRRLLELGRKALERNKPILVWKAGNTTAGQKAAASHTASLASTYALYQAAFRQGGYVEVDDYEDLVDLAKAFLAGTLPRGDRVGLVSGSGGAGVIASDRFMQAGLQLPEFSATTKSALRDMLPPLAGTGNPVDISGQNTKDGKSLSNAAAEAVLADENIDMVMVRSGQTTGSVEAAQSIIDIARAAGKPVLVATVAEDHLPAKALFDAAGLPWFLTVGRAATAARALADFSMRQQKWAVRPRTIQRAFPRPELSFPAGETFLSERASRGVLAQYGIPLVRQEFVPADAVDRLNLQSLTFPVVVKVNSPDIPHKSEAGAIRVNLTTPEGVRSAAREVIAAARNYAPDARIDGVLVQEMAKGTELLLGAADDACFGPIVLFGLGGIFAEVMADVVYRFAPFDRLSAQDMLAEIKGAKLLQGYRGQSVADLDALADIAVRLGWLMNDYRDAIESIDINPIFVNGSTILAADALIALKGRG